MPHVVDAWELMIVLIGSIDFVTATMLFKTDPARAVSSLMRLSNHTVGKPPNMMLATIDSATNFSSSDFYLYGRVPAHTSPSSSPSNHSLSCLIRASVSPA